jgi:hypothetical protein
MFRESDAQMILCINVPHARYVTCAADAEKFFKRNAAPAGCSQCGMVHGKLCPYVKAIETRPDGTSRVEYFSPAEMLVMIPANVEPVRDPTRAADEAWKGIRQGDKT